MRRRVVVTGIGMLTPIGHDLASARSAFFEGRHGIRRMHEWDSVTQLDTRVGAPVDDVDLSRAFDRKVRRTMGRVALLSAKATDDAVAMAGLDEAILHHPRTGIAHGSTQGSTAAMEEWFRTVFANNGMQGVTSGTYLQFMSHTTAANLAIRYGIKGRVLTTCSACVSASQAIGYGYEAIRFGATDVMLCGGAEEMHFTHAGVFDVMFAASRRHNDRPELAPRPFDVDRDGLVVGEGAGTLVLEALEHAQGRGAPIFAEVLGFGTNCDGSHATNPSSEGMAGAMRLALEDAGLSPSAIEYVNAHATATEVGDIAESQATNAIFGERVPVSSTKSFTGHTLGACGAIEAAFCIDMIREGYVAPTRTLERVDPRCAPLDHVIGTPRRTNLRIAMSNNFAFGGINTSLIFGRYEP